VGASSAGTTGIVAVMRRIWTLVMETSLGNRTTSAPMSSPKAIVNATTRWGDQGFQRGLNICS
jgi:hypothetical protein